MALTDAIARILKRRQAYRRLFVVDDGKVGSRDAEIVLSDLRRFCHGSRPTYRISPATGVIDPLAMAASEGRREVWLRLQEFLHIDDADIARLQEHQERTQEHGS